MGERRKMQVRVIKENKPIEKAEGSLQITEQEAFYSGEWLSPEYNMKGLKTLVNNSIILPQCIRAYKNNIAGFGIGIRYTDDTKETSEMAAEFERAQEIIELLNIDQKTAKVFGDVIEARETYGIAYIEVIRNLAGEVAQIEFVKETQTITKTRKLDPYIETVFYHHGKEAKRMRRFCKYKQEIGGKTVYFREFGDPRIMDRRNGEYIEAGETLELAYQANEIMEFAIGVEPYGEVRWIGQTLGVDGSRKAEILNNNYFENGRHTPLLIAVEGGTITRESYDKLQEYMDDIKGEKGQHAFILLETEGVEAKTDFEQTDKPKITIHNLASILQKDELFQGYIENGRKRVQSAFLLPDLYVGFTTDFNRATAQAAMEVTEKQVFQPERDDLAWIINNRLLNEYRFKYVEAYFLAPDISNADDLYKLLTATNNAGGVTPNFAKRIIYNAYGETAEDYEGDWGNVPLAYSTAQAAGMGTNLDQLTMSLQKQIEKAAENRDDDIVPVLKEVRRILKKDFTFALNGGIIEKEWDESMHPRDELGRFSSTGGGGGASGDSEGSSGGGAAPARGDFGGADTTTFTAAVQAAKEKQNPAVAWRVTAMSQEEFEQEHPGACCHITEDGSVAAVTKEGDIVSVCGMPGDNIRGAALLQMAVDAGGVKLDSYDGNHGFYVSHGFEPVSWCKWNDNAADEGWINQDWLKVNGLPSDITTAELRKIPNSSLAVPREDIVFYKYTGSSTKFASREEAKEHLSRFKATVDPHGTDYGAAYEARDKSL